MKLLLYRAIGAGFGELETDVGTTLSEVTGPPLKVAGIPAVREERFLACASALIPDALGRDPGDAGRVSPA